MISIFCLLALILFFTLLGLGFTTKKTNPTDFLLLPTIGYAALIGLTYIISANFGLSGADSVCVGIILLLGIVLLRLKTISSSLSQGIKHGLMYDATITMLLPMMTLLLPAIVIGFKYYYGGVNFDYFYNSQDSWFLSTHSVLQYSSDYKTGTADILPLDWSANPQGRFGISLIGAFFLKYAGINALEFNSLLLSSLVVIFALGMSVMCQELFGLKGKILLFAVLVCIASGAYVQSYNYYLLGQISAIPVFILFCILLKRFLDNIDAERTNSNILSIALVVNTLYVLYAILSAFAVFLGGACCLLYLCHKQLRAVLIPAIQVIVMTGIVYVLMNIFALHHSLGVITSWINLSTKVATGHSTIIFPQYMHSTTFLGLLFGLFNYPEYLSLFLWIVHYPVLENTVFSILGLGTLITFSYALMIFAKDNRNNISARTVVLMLAAITIISSFAFFMLSAPYGIFKMQVWFMPILMPIFVVALMKGTNKNSYSLLTICCGIVLLLNFATSSIYMRDSLIADARKKFVLAQGISGNKDIDDFANQLNSRHPGELSLFLSNGTLSAWLGNYIRNENLNLVTHNSQTLADKDFEVGYCIDLRSKAYTPKELWVLQNPKFIQSDITDFPVEAKVIYKNDTFELLDPKNIDTYIFMGSGVYPIEYGKNAAGLPVKIRPVEKNAEIVIYSNKERMVTLSIAASPGHSLTQNAVRDIAITGYDVPQRHYVIKSGTTITIDNVRLRNGFNYFTVDGATAKAASTQKKFNFTISHISVS